jgi:nucleoside-diphosphate-sugar epimerase
MTFALNRGVYLSYCVSCKIVIQHLPLACKQCGVTRLVYTSTTNVIFCGEPIINGDETLPYAPNEKHVDHYSRTKSIAEQIVLQANGSKVAGGKILYTCAIRPAGIYGEGEQRHLPRIVVSSKCLKCSTML